MRTLPSAVYRVFQSAARDALAGTPDLTRYHVLAGVSGGLDSMVLLTFLVWLRQQRPFPLSVAHLDHGLRPEAAHDADLVSAYAARFGLDVHLQKDNVAARAAAEKEGLEAAGRTARYAFFAELAAAFDLPVLVALAHHRHDQAETVLLNITRGSGLSGLTGMAPLDGNRWRPFLSISRNDLEMVADQLQIPFAEDKTNLSDAFLRNRLRHRLLPLWSELAERDMTDKLCSLAKRLRDEDDALGQLAAELKNKVSIRPGEYAVMALQESPKALIRRVLELCYREHTGGRMLQAAHTDLLLLLIRQGGQFGTVSLPQGAKAVLSHGILRFVTDRPHE